mgnify:CR=1 FL=1|jgi:hypothetical protein
MKYIEEIEPGQSFVYQEDNFLMTSDFKKSGDRLSISLTNGVSRWMGASETVDLVVLYTIDEESNLKHIRKEDANDPNKNI